MRLLADYHGGLPARVWGLAAVRRLVCSHACWRLACPIRDKGKPSKRPFADLTRHRSHSSQYLCPQMHDGLISFVARETRYTWNEPLRRRIKSWREPVQERKRKRAQPYRCLAPLLLNTSALATSHIHHLMVAETQMHHYVSFHSVSWCFLPSSDRPHKQPATNGHLVVLCFAAT